MTIGKIILQQIQEQDRFALMAWGAKDFVESQNGVMFLIRTPLYPVGVVVEITLNAFDTYDIKVFRKKSLKVLKLAKNIYCDSLIETIDHLIEENKKTTIIF